jgi:hypothetical protein
MCSREAYGYAIPYDRSEGKKADKYDISWNPEYGATNNCNNPHMSLPHQSVPLEVEVIQIPVFYLFDNKCEITKERKKK